MANQANKWVKKRIPELKRELGGKCQHRGCGEKRLSKLEFAHKRVTKICGNGARGRKEKVADINKHRSSYTLRCHKHHVQDFKQQHSRLIKKGKSYVRNKRGRKT